MRRSASAFESLPYRPCVGVMLLNARGEVFVGRRLDTVAEAWQMPQGGMDEGEEPRAAAFRELAEEIGTNKARVLAEAEEWLTYDLPPELIGKLWGGKYRGQRQKWFLMRFEGGDEDVNLATAHPEFQAWRWVQPSRLPDLIVPFKRALYFRLVEMFSEYLQG